MKFSAITKNISRLGAGTTAAFILAVGMVMPASAMSTTAATQLDHSSQVSQVTKLGFTYSEGKHPHFHHFNNYFAQNYDYPYWWYPYWNNINNIDNSIHNCPTNINNVGGIVINNGNSC